MTMYNKCLFIPQQAKKSQSSSDCHNSDLLLRLFMSAD